MCLYKAHTHVSLLSLLRHRKDGVLLQTEKLRVYLEHIRVLGHHLLLRGIHYRPDCN